MLAFTEHCGQALRLPWENIDTDQIIPARYLHRPRNAGYREQLFHDLRFTPDGKQPRVDFPLNDPTKAESSILVSGKNFGCGSSREHAVWALLDYGFRVVIAPDFGDIFFNNSLKNGLLAIRLDERSIEALMQNEGEPTILTVDLPQQSITTRSGLRYEFEIDPYRKEALLNGESDIQMTFRLYDEITKFETRYIKDNPWIYTP
ncbi:3-isopropylmalate dehydratase small subunit [Billgrantia endophytica]|uniref:3-isopropylmalate dehydratase small subunit n=1 Tax=Billgrantia endophytica TaxID=2033802 RepID=A0A2N7TZH8_9GAMM|nr:3-isopropylmalate dehydratase small subunit [Halomonas endophytica]PMR73581.1 3-isopropylmalate dehydratase small subunit [Halomonas endophytica]